MALRQSDGDHLTCRPSPGGTLDDQPAQHGHIMETIMLDLIGPVVKYPLRLQDFPGFYESYLSGALDHCEEQEAEYAANDRQDDDGIPRELRLDEAKFSEILMECADYAQMREDMAEAYAECLDTWCEERFGFHFNSNFHSLWSPREYNFSTNELTIWVPESTIRTLMVRSMANDHQMLGALIKENCTSRSGFVSYYTNDLSEWLQKPMLEWDEIELGFLLEAVSQIGRDRHDESMARQVTDMVCEDEGPYHIVSNNIDWTKYEKLVQEARDELEEQHRADVDPDYVPPAARCAATIDMFKGSYA